MFNQIKCGDRVTIKTPQGSIVSGKAVMYNRKFASWVLNMGGKNGMPGLASEKNAVEVKPAKVGSKFALQSAIINGGFGQ